MFSDQKLLRQLLLRPQHPLVGILDGPLRRKVTPSVALLMLKGGTFEWYGSTRRVRKMRLVNPALGWEPCYRTTEAPTIQPSIEWLRTRNTGGYAAVTQTQNPDSPS